MGTNTNKRIGVKWVRDKAKSAYEKQSECHICGSTEELELHHTNSLTLLLEKWAKDNNYDISSDEGIVSVRNEFIDAHHSEIYVEVFTLCAKHHQKLHGVFGKAPALSTAEKQNRWIEKQKAKVLGIESADDKPKGSFSAFY
jgi:5-methylcytosine-specific restriction endonuclease McrA